MKHSLVVVPRKFVVVPHTCQSNYFYFILGFAFMNIPA